MAMAKVMAMATVREKMAKAVYHADQVTILTFLANPLAILSRKTSKHSDHKIYPEPALAI